MDNIKKQVNKYHSDMELSGSGDADYGHNLAEKVLEQEKKEKGGENIRLVSMENQGENYRDVLRLSGQMNYPKTCPYF